MVAKRMLALTAALVLAAGGGLVFGVEKVIEKSFPASPGAELILKSDRGSIRVDTGAPDKVDARALIQKVATSVVASLVGDDRHIQVEMVAPQPVELASPQATNMAIILNELVGNALKHGLKDLPEGHIRVELQAGDDDLTLVVADDGHGLDHDLTSPAHQGLGLLLVKTMAEGEFKGRFTLRSAEKGAAARLVIPWESLRGPDTRTNVEVST